MRSERPLLSTRFVVVMTPAMRDGIGQAAEQAGVSDGSWVRSAIREKLERDAQPS